MHPRQRYRNHRNLLQTLEPRILMAGTPTSQTFAATQPLFIENKGQWSDGSLRYALSASGVGVGFRQSELAFNLFQNSATAPKATGFSLSFDGSNRITPTGVDPTASRFNYYVGDRSSWRTGVKGYQSVAYRGLYKGIDLLAFGQRDSLKYEFHVAPSANFHQIQVRFKGIDRLTVDSKGALHIRPGQGFAEIVEDAPVVYQVVNGKQKTIAARFVLHGKDRYSIDVTGKYDHSKSLVIDPNVEWSTYLGGTSLDETWDIASDGNGTSFITGNTTSSNFVGANNLPIAGKDGFIAKVNSAGTLQWATYFGGTLDEAGNSIAVDGSGNALVAGKTNSLDFAGATNLPQGGDSDAFVVKVNGAGVLQWAEYLGGDGTDIARGIALDSLGNAFITGETNSTNFMAKTNDTLGDREAFLSRVNSDGAVQWSTYLGGTSWDFAAGLAIDGASNILVVGTTGSADLTGRINSYTDGGDLFVAKFNTSGALQWSSYIGDIDYEEGTGIALGPGGTAFLTGYVYSTNLPGKTNEHHGGTADAFVIKVNAAGAALWSTYLGGNSWDSGFDITSDGNGNVLLTGDTFSNHFDGSVNNTAGGSDDAFVAKVDGAGALTWAMYVGGKNDDVGWGITMDGLGNALLAGNTTSNNLPNPTNATSTGGDAFISKISDPVLPKVLAVYVRSSAWTPAFLDMLAQTGQGDATLGYLVPLGSAAQLNGLWWNNVDQVSIVFSQNVTVTQDSLAITGVSVPTYGFSNFAYNANSHVATWTLAQPILTDAVSLSLASTGPSAVASPTGTALDGEWSNSVSTISGNGTAGGDFIFQVRTLPADANGDGVVNFSDFVILSNNFGQPNVASDFNGDGVVNFSDFVILSNNFGAVAPIFP